MLEAVWRDVTDINLLIYLSAKAQNSRDFSKCQTVPLKRLQSTSWLHGVETVGVGVASNLGRSADQGPGPDYRPAPCVPHNKIMLSGPTGIWFQWRG